MTPPDEVDAGKVHDVMLELAQALTERFPDREPSEQEVRAFLEEHLRDSGRSDQEIEAILSDIDD